MINKPIELIIKLDGSEIMGFWTWIGLVITLLVSGSLAFSTARYFMTVAIDKEAH